MPPEATHVAFRSSSGLNFRQMEPPLAIGSPYLLAPVLAQASVLYIAPLAVYPWPEAWGIPLEEDSSTQVEFLALAI